MTPNRFLLGPVWHSMPVLRDHGRYHASYEDVPEGEEVYPTYISGWIRISSPGTARAIMEAAQVVRFFWIEDVWVTGYIAEYLQIEHQVLMQ